MSGIRSLRRGPTVIGSATDSSAPIYVDSDDNIAKFVPSGSGTTEVQIADVSSAQTFTNKTLTAPVISSIAADLSVVGTISSAHATTPDINTAAGKTNTGTVTVNGKTSGKLVLTAADSTAQTVTVTTAAQTSGASTLTIPDQAGANSSFVFTSLAQTLTNKTLTSPIVNTPTVKDLTEVVAATNVITAAETGSVFFLNSATEFASTLPAPAAGLHFTFIISAAPSGASYTVGTNAAATIIKGRVLTNDVNSATDADFGTAGEATLTFVDGKSVAGDTAEFWCDGTNWFVVATSTVFDGITIS